MPTPINNMVTGINGLVKPYAASTTPFAYPQNFKGLIPLTANNSAGNTNAGNQQQNNTQNTQNQGLVSNIQNQISQDQSKIMNAQNAGYGTNQQFSYDAQGNLITANPNQGNTVPTYPTLASSGMFPAAAQGLIGTASQPTTQYTVAQQQYLDANARLQALQTEAANQSANIQGSRTNLAEAGGEQGILQNLVANQSAALGNEMAAAQASAGAATTQQQAQQSGLAAAGGLVQPQLGQYGQAYYQPLNAGANGAGAGGTGVSPSDPFYGTMQTYAQMMVNGQISSIPSSVTGNPVLQAQLIQMAQQINPNFNINQATATGQTQQAQTQQQQTYQSAAQQAKNLGIQLNQLITTAGINPSDVNALNSFIQKMATNTSDPNYQTFQNLVNDMSNTYAQVLTPAGGSTTDMVRSISQSLINSAQSGQSIIQVMQNLDAQVQAKISGVTTAYGNTIANGPTNTGTTAIRRLYHW